MHALVAEDNDINQAILRKVLTKFGCTSSFVWNGQEALDYLSNPNSVKPDIIFMDIQMPVMGGMEAFNVIRTKPPFCNDPVLRSTPIVATNPNTYYDRRNRWLEMGFDDTLIKPMRPPHIRRILMRWSRGRFVRDPHNQIQGQIQNQHLHNPQQLGLAAGPVPGFVYMKNWGGMPLRQFRGPRSLL